MPEQDENVVKPPLGFQLPPPRSSPPQEVSDLSNSFEAALRHAVDGIPAGLMYQLTFTKNEDGVVEIVPKPALDAFIQDALLQQADGTYLLSFTVRKDQGTSVNVSVMVARINP